MKWNYFILKKKQISVSHCAYFLKSILIYIITIKLAIGLIIPIELKGIHLIR